MLCGVTRASVRAGGDMGPNRLRQTRAKAQCGTFSSRSRAGERAVTFPVHMVSLLTGPKVASLADMATLRLPVLHRGRGGVLRFRAEFYRSPRSTGSRTNVLGAAGRVAMAEQQSKLWVKKVFLARYDVR